MRKGINACFTSNTDDWKTPKELYDHIISLGFIDTFQYQATYNEFNNSYKNKKLFINPPFSKLKEVCDWVNIQLNHHNCVILLIPARTDTQYFHTLLSKHRATIYFIKGRLHYNDSKCAPFPSIALLFDTRKRTSYKQKYKFGDLEQFKTFLSKGRYHL